MNARNYAHEIASRFARCDTRYTVSSNLKVRSGRLFIDYLRNGRGTTAIGAFSPRARPRFPVAMPISLGQIERGIRSDAFTMAALSRRKALT
jgi:bifunctional non-homologous end joining protein LigD